MLRESNPRSTSILQKKLLIVSLTMLKRNPKASLQQVKYHASSNPHRKAGKLLAFARHLQAFLVYT